jgi:hypothetical protein
MLTAKDLGQAELLENVWRPIVGIQHEWQIELDVMLVGADLLNEIEFELLKRSRVARRPLVHVEANDFEHKSSIHEGETAFDEHRKAFVELLRLKRKLFVSRYQIRHEHVEEILNSKLKLLGESLVAMHSDSSAGDEEMRHRLDDDVEDNRRELHELVDEEEVGVVGMKQRWEMLADLSMDGVR